jgi:hypothetical protein
MATIADDGAYRCYAVRQEGPRVLYRWKCCGAEEWSDFSRQMPFRKMGADGKRRAEAVATFVLGWHSEKKGGADDPCPKCLPEAAAAKRALLRNRGNR